MGALALGPRLGRTFAKDGRHPAAAHDLDLAATVNRWGVRAFALLGLAVCFILPLGAIGTIDASFDSSVAVPLSRSSGRVLAEQAKQAERAVVERGALDAADGRGLVPAPFRAIQGVLPASTATLLTAFVLLALLAPVTPRLTGRPQPGLPRRRGPPSSR